MKNDNSSHYQESESEMSLDQKKPGFEGTIRRIEGSDLKVERLFELGFAPGKKIRFRSRTLWGDPLIIELDHISVSLRKLEARCIIV